MPNPISSTDLDYLREVAESGQQAPLLGGRFLAWWGALTSIAYATHYAIGTGLVAGGGSAYAWLWGVFLVLGMGGQFVLVRTLSPTKPGAASMGNRAERVVWQASGFALFGYFVALMIKSAVTGVGDMGFAYSLAVVFIVYGVSLITTGILGESAILQRAGIGALCLVPVAAWFAGTAASWLIASLGAALCVFLPGLVMLRHEPRDVE
jgi:hypothetical protein